MIGKRWQQVLDTRGDAVAVYFAEGTLTFAQIDERARRLHADDDHVLARGGAIELLTACIAGFTRGLPVHVVEKDRTRRVPASGIPAGTSLIKQTVGGSGVRRCQFFTEEQILSDVDRLHRALGLKEDHVCVAAISPAHSYGLTVTVLQTVLHGVPMHWLPEPFPAPLNVALHQHARVFLPGIPALWRAWLMGGVDLDRVDLAISAGSPLTLELERYAFDAHGVKLHNLYGTSECGAVAYDATATLREDASLLGTLLPDVQAEVADTLVVQSDAVGIGYDELLPCECFGDGRFQTCDRITIADDGLHFVESIGAGINVAGRKLCPDEIAAKLRNATGVAKIDVRGQTSRDPERCQEVVAHVGLPQAEISVEFRQKACADLAPWEIPRRWVGI
ncbi:MAG: AMP-binding protein [Verrucomicrobiaceae bacterium]|nr:AMP-binding protein [Verrucomicrobiaceae bacterium]